MKKISPTFVVAAVVVTLSVFILLSMLFYSPADYFERGDRVSSNSYYGLRFSVAALFFGNLGIGAYVGWMIILAWAVIVFFRESVGELAIRGVSLCVTVFSAAALAELLSGAKMGGTVGYAIGDVLQASFGSTLGVILMGAILLVSLVLATDFGFVSYYREARDALAVVDRDDEPEDDEPEDLISRIEKAAREVEEEAQATKAGPILTGDGRSEPIVLNLRSQIPEERLDEELMTAESEESAGEEPAGSTEAGSLEGGLPDDERFEAVAMPPRPVGEAKSTDEEAEAESPVEEADVEDEAREAEADDRFEAVALPPAPAPETEVEETPEAETEAPVEAEAAAAETAADETEAEIAEEPEVAAELEVAAEPETDPAVEAEVEAGIAEPVEEEPDATIETEEEIPAAEMTEVEEEPAAEPEPAVLEGPDPHEVELADAEEEEEEPFAEEVEEPVAHEAAAEPEAPEREVETEAEEDDEVRTTFKPAPHISIETEPMEDELGEPEGQVALPLAENALASVFDALLGPADDPLTEDDEQEVEAFLMRQTRAQPAPSAVEDPEMVLQESVVELDDSIPGAEEPEPDSQPDSRPDSRPESPPAPTPEPEEEPVAEAPPHMSYAVLDPVFLVDDEISIDSSVGEGTEIDEEIETSEVRTEATAAEPEPEPESAVVETPEPDAAEIEASETDAEDEDGNSMLPFMKDGDQLPVLEDLATPGRKGVFRSLFKRRREPAGASTAEDSLLDDAAELVLERGRASVVLLQRRLDIGYTRATRLIDTLEDVGLVGPMTETGSREVLLTREAWEGRSEA